MRTEPAIYDAQGGVLTAALANWAEDSAALDPRCGGHVTVVGHPDTIAPLKSSLPGMTGAEFDAAVKTLGLITRRAATIDFVRGSSGVWIEDERAERGVLWALNAAGMVDIELLDEFALSKVINLACEVPKAAGA